MRQFLDARDMVNHITAESDDAQNVRHSHIEPPEHGTNVRVALGVVAAMAGILAGISPFLTPALRKHVLPYVPATDGQLADVIALCRRALASTGSGHDRSTPLRMIDLGSGDGRVVRALWRAFGKDGTFCDKVSVTGVEMNWWLVLFSRLKALRDHMSPKDVAFVRGDLFSLDFGQYDIIVLFGVDGMMADIENKLVRDFQSVLPELSASTSAPVPAPAALVQNEFQDHTHTHTSTRSFTENESSECAADDAAQICLNITGSSSDNRTRSIDTYRTAQRRRPAVVCTRFALPTWKSHTAQGLAWLYYVDENVQP